jgi:hypothetical protein
MTNGRLDISGTVEAFVEEIAARMAVRPITAKVAVLANQFPSQVIPAILATG